MKLIDHEKFWEKIRSSPNIVIGVNDYEDLVQIFPEKYPHLKKISRIYLNDSFGWFRSNKANPVLDLLLWASESKIDESSLSFDIDPVVQIYLALPDSLVLSDFPTYLGEVCCMQSSFDEDSLKQAWRLVKNNSIEWIILDTTDDNFNCRYILIEKEDVFSISDELREVLNTFKN